jgi:hypothetical protein
MPLLIFILIFIQSCLSYVVQDNLPEYLEKDLGNNEIEIHYKDGDIFRGNKDMTYGIFYSKDGKAKVGISKEYWGEFKYRNELPEWCESGDCQNGEGVTNPHDISNIVPSKLKDEGYLKKYLFKFSGKFKNFKGKDGQYTLNYNNKDYIILKMKDGNLIDTKDYLSFKKAVDKDLIESEKAEIKYREDQKKQLLQFINKMFDLGAQDYNSCVRLCERYKITYNCNSKCQDAMNINR